MKGIDEVNRIISERGALSIDEVNALLEEMDSMYRLENTGELL